MKTWSCKIGETDQLPDTVVEHSVVHGADSVGVRHKHSSPDQVMRSAVEEAYRELTGDDPTFVFSGWGGELNESERAVHEDREPEYLRTGWLEEQVNELRIRLRDGEPLPADWGWAQWTAMITIKVGHAMAMFATAPESYVHDQAADDAHRQACQNLLAVAASALDAIEALETVQAGTKA